MASRVVVRLSAFALVLPLAACGGAGISQTPTSGADQPSASVEASTAATTTTSDVTGCASANPEDVGDLTGVWAGDDGGYYYIRQIGDCVWWFGTSLAEVQPGVTAQEGFANVAVGRIEGDEIVLEWADVPLGDILGGGGLTIHVSEDGDELAISHRQRGPWGFGGTTLTRASGEASASPSASP